MEGKRISIPWTTVALVLIIALAVPWAVWADNTVPDGDGTTPVAANPLQLGTVCTGSTTLDTVLVAISRNGSYGSTNVFLKSSSVTITVLSVSGTGLSASVVAPGTIAIPSNWDTVANNTMSPSVTSNVTFVAGSTAGSFSGSITYRATGISSKDGSTLTRDATVSVDATLQSCTPPDTTPPAASPTQSPTANANGWNNTNVTITWNWADNPGGLGIDTANCTMTSVASAEGEYNVTATCKDLAGNTGTASYGVKIDKTAPTASPTQNPAANTNGWNNSSVTITWNWSDGTGSGLDACTPTSVASGEGIYNVTDTCYDLAGNSHTASYGVKIDTTAPTISFTNCPGNVILGSSVSVAWTASDSLSGLATPASGSVTLDTSSVLGNPKTAYTPWATDQAGNTARAACSYNVIYNWAGFFQPVDNLPTFNSVKAGSAIPVKFSLSGNQGLAIFAAGFPKSQPISCNSSAPTDGIEETVTAGQSSLSYDPLVDQYVYVWKTDKAWAGTCRQLVVKLNDGTSHYANFKFK